MRGRFDARLIGRLVAGERRGILAGVDELDGIRSDERAERLAARVDLKSDRNASALLVHAASAERGVKAHDVAAPLAAELRGMATWLGLERVVVAKKGDLAAPLRSALATRPT